MLGCLQLDYRPITRVENVCATDTEALRGAAYAVAAGVYDIALTVGVEKLKDHDRAGLPETGAEHPVFYGLVSGPGSYAMAATRYFHRYGLTPEEGKTMLAKIAVKHHRNGTLSPKAHFRREVTLEQVLNAPIIARPLGLFDCCPTTDGAAAAIVTRADLAKSFRSDYVLIKGLGVSVGRINYLKGSVRPEYDYTHWEETERAAAQAYDEAGVKNPRTDISTANIHDCFTITEAICYESLGFSPRGKAKEDIDSGFFTLEGELPVNTDGGLKSFGHPVGATGLRMTYECYKQLQGKAGPRQVKNPKLALTQNQGGLPGTFQACVGIFGSRD